jgi:hypothetical protein
MLRIPAGLLALGLVLPDLGATSAAADGNGLVLLGLFQKTCAQRPALPTTLQRLAKAAGFESEHTITAEMESGANLDIVYFAKLVQGAATVKMSAYFSGSRDAPVVNCSTSTTGVNAKDLATAVEAAEHVASPSTQVSNDGAVVRLKWTFGSGDANDWLEMSSRRDEPRLAGLNLSYQVRKP